MSQVVATLDVAEKRVRRLRRVYDLLDKLANESEAVPEGGVADRDVHQQPQSHHVLKEGREG